MKTTPKCSRSATETATPPFMKSQSTPRLAANVINAMATSMMRTFRIFVPSRGISRRGDGSVARMGFMWGHPLSARLQLSYVGFSQRSASRHRGGLFQSFNRPDGESRHRVGRVDQDSAADQP